MSIKIEAWILKVNITQYTPTCVVLHIPYDLEIEENFSDRDNNI